MSDEKFLPYGRHHITDEDISAVVEVLRSDWLTQGPAVPEFEDALAASQGTTEAVACSSGTAALHLSMLALCLGPGDAVITTPNTFVASANCGRYVGAHVLFADIDPDTGLIDPGSVERILQQDREQTVKAVIPVHFAGQPADLPTLHETAARYGAWIVDDASHAIGASYMHGDQCYRLGGNPHSDLTAFSFHPVKHVAMGEGGAVVTDNAELAERLQRFRNHGISRADFANPDLAFSPNGVPNPWYHEMHQLGYNYRLTDIQAALGRSQLSRLQHSIGRRTEIAGIYRKLISETFPESEVTPLALRPDVTHAYHLFVVKIDFDRIGIPRALVMNRLRARGIGTQVHYIPVHLQPYYRQLGPEDDNELPGALAYYRRTLSLPMYPELTDDDIMRVVAELAIALERETVSVQRQHQVSRN